MNFEIIVLLNFQKAEDTIMIGMLVYVAAKKKATGLRVGGGVLGEELNDVVTVSLCHNSRRRP